MKQTHINLLRAAANILQSSLIQDENIGQLRYALGQARAKHDEQRIKTIESMIEFAKNRNKEFLEQYADTLKQIIQLPIDKAIEVKSELHPVFEEIFKNHLTPLS